MTDMPKEHWNLITALRQIEESNYECEAGALKLNDAYIWLKKALLDGPEFLPGQGVWYLVEAEVVGKKLTEWVHFFVVGCSMTSDTERRLWLYDLSYDPPQPYSAGKIHYTKIRGSDLKLTKPEDK